MKSFTPKLVVDNKNKDLIREIRETPCEDGTGYYHSDSREQLTHKDVEQLKKEKDTIIKKLSTDSMTERYKVVLRFCELYQSWALAKKLQQTENITRQETFEIHPELPLKITH